MSLDRNFLYEKNFKRFLDFWNSEVEKKLFRCSKEYGAYNQLKKTLNPNSKSDWDYHLYKIYNLLLKDLSSHLNCMIDFTADDRTFFIINRKYCVRTALNSNRHLSQIVIFGILQKSQISEKKINQIFVEMDKELFKGHKLNAFLTEKWNLIKVFFS